VVAAVCAYRSSIGVRPSPAGQQVLTALAVSGDLSRHLRLVRRELLGRRDLLVDALSAAALPMRGDQAGAHLVVDLPGADANAGRCVALCTRGSCSTGWHAVMTGCPLGME
jgi:GntR family transcriptional regulator/MocR family aminotransferase